MSGVFGQRLGRRNSRTGADRSSVKYCVSSQPVLRHAKKVYDWLNAAFASRYITFGRVKASERRITSGCSRLISPASHSQNGNGLLCGLPTRKNLTPWSIQNSTIESSSAHSSGHASHSKSNG